VRVRVAVAVATAAVTVVIAVASALVVAAIVVVAVAVNRFSFNAVFSASIFVNLGSSSEELFIHPKIANIKNT
jgi:hypothetical protein